MSSNTSRLVSIVARNRDINARGRGSDTYAMIGLPESGRLAWADQVDGVTVISDSYPRSRSIRSDDRHGSQVIHVELPIGTVIVYVDKHTDGKVTRSAVRVTVADGELTEDGLAVRASTLPECGVVSRKRDGGWVSVIDGVEYA